MLHAEESPTVATFEGEAVLSAAEFTERHVFASLLGYGLIIK
jgi:hypothetical protein